MLHSKDRWLLTQEVIPWLLANGYQTITYADLLAQMEGRQTPFEKQVILSIDDINTEYINPYFLEMVEDLHERGLVAVIGINPNNTVEDNPESYEVLKSWASWGMELANHTLNHTYLPPSSEEYLDEVIGGANDRIEAGTGIRPISLILPFGAIADKNGVIDENIFEMASQDGIRFVIGILDGRLVTYSDDSMFVGRVGTDNAVWNLDHWVCR